MFSTFPIRSFRKNLPLPAQALVLIALCFALSSAVSGQTTFSNTSAITITDGATPPTPASVYPSNINVSGMTGTILRVTVTLNGFNHTFPDDVDMMLVSPTGAKLVLFSDVCGSTAATNLNITLSDAGASIIPDAGPCTTGTFRPSNVGTGDTFAAPAPAPGNPTDYAAPAGTATFTSKFAGTNPNGTWSLYIVDDLSGDGGSITGGWSLTITSGTTFSNSSPMTITDSALPPTPASTYPSTINVSGMTGTITALTVRLNGLSHTFPDDVDMMLVSPTGARLVLWSDACGSTAASNITVTLDDGASSILPDAGPCTSGTFRPSNVGTGDTFAAPAPAPSNPTDYAAPAGTATLASKFNGISPNGTWSLYIVDDLSGDGGSIANGWSLTIATNAPPTAAPGTLSGRVTNAFGSGVANARLSILNPVTLETKYATTSPFGYYRVEGLPVGIVYIVTVEHKQYTFQNNPRAVSLLEDMEEQFVAENP
ncbi:MAG: carboxypeptidase-like regulatory domain-containing protein [Acidobacteriota bacterium]|nr:carboxypeptidase-like regulatory domain-containing protein [Acidobacteriota bacterium]